MKKNNKIKIIVMLLLLITFFYFLLNNITLLSPKEIIYERSPEFKWGGFYSNYELIISNNSKFVNPIIIRTHSNSYKLTQNLNLGEYYWKLQAKTKNKVIESNIAKFKIDSIVAIEIKEERIENVGNVQIYLRILEKIKDKLIPTGAVVLEVKDSLEIENKSKLYIAEQNE